MQTRPMYSIVGAGTLLPALALVQFCFSQAYLLENIASEEQQALLHETLPMAVL